MAGKTTENRGAWGGKIGFILAASGSAVGLGNLWKFPYLAYENGGGKDGQGAGTFVLLYLFAVLIVGFPVMLAEIMVGRRSRRNPVGAFKVLRPKSPWFLVGALGVITGFLLLSYYAVVAGWTGEYFIQAITGKLAKSSPEEIKLSFGAFLDNPVKQVLWLVGFMGLSMAVVIGGVSKGIERVTKFLMPILLFMLLFLAFKAINLSGGSKAITYLFKPDFSTITPKLVLDALGQAFFSLSLGMGAIITYGSYLSRKDNIAVSGASIVVLDTMVGIVAAIIIIATILSFDGVQMESGSVGNLFTAIPVIFKGIPGGNFMMIAFYTLVAFAALTSTISLLEVVVSYFVDEKSWSRKRAVLLTGGAITLLGIPSALSFNLLKGATVNGKSFFDIMDYLCANWFLPVGGLAIALFAGWILTREEKLDELKNNLRLYRFWNICVRFIAPLAIAAVLLGIIFNLGGQG